MEFRQGERLVTLRAIDARCFITTSRMLSELRTVTIPAGEILVVGPVFRADEVDSRTRAKPGYGGYQLVVERTVLTECCQPLVQPEGQIPEERELTADEQVLLKWLLENGVPSAGMYLDQLPRVRVISRCGCGCASLNFDVDGTVTWMTRRRRRTGASVAALPLAFAAERRQR